MHATAAPVMLSDIFRHYSRNGKSVGFAVHTDTGWTRVTRGDARCYLRYKGLNPTISMGEALLNPYHLVYRPFEIVAENEINLAPKLIQPKPGEHPTWDRLDPLLILWLTYLIRCPRTPLPLVFIYGPGSRNFVDGIAAMVQGGIEYLDTRREPGDMVLGVLDRAQKDAPIKRWLESGKRLIQVSDKRTACEHLDYMYVVEFPASNLPADDLIREAPQMICSILSSKLPQPQSKWVLPI